MFEQFAREAEFARLAVLEAADCCRRVQQEMVVRALEKSDRSPVTVADFASQALVASSLAESFPADPLVAEEDSAALRGQEGRQLRATVHSHVSQRRPGGSEKQILQWIDRGNGQPADRFWTLDPIDGTAGFLRGDQWVVALALIEDGQVVVGALALPCLDADLAPEEAGPGTVIVAVEGEGAWLDRPTWLRPSRLAVSTRSVSMSVRVMGSVERGHTDMDMMDRLMRSLGTAEDLVKMDSQAKYAIVANGGAELILRLLSPHRPGYKEKIWDQAAGSRIVHEAGGQVTDLLGRPLDFSTGARLTANRGVVVSNSLVHDRVLAAIQAEGADQPPDPP